MSCELGEINGFLKTRCEDNRGEIWLKCMNSDVYYREDAHYSMEISLQNLCKNDTVNYQVCGVWTSNKTQQQNPVCGEYFCQNEKSKFNALSTRYFVKKYSCNGKNDCKNTDADEMKCPARKENVTMYTCSSWDNEITEALVCDGKCDCTLCDDESDCRGHVLGTWCKGSSYGQERTFIPPTEICDKYRLCPNNDDEENCESNRTCYNSMGYVVHLTDRNICAVPNYYTGKLEKFKFVFVL